MGGKKKLVIWFQAGGICDDKVKTETTSLETGTSVLLCFSVQLLLLYCFVLLKYLQMFILHMLLLSQARWTAEVHAM